MRSLGRTIRPILDWIYFIGGVIAAFFLVAILALIVVQMVARWIGAVAPGAADYAGYCMAAASFFAFAYALNHGSHIRVSIVLNLLGKSRRYLEAWCFVIASALTWYLSWYAVKAVYWSWKFNDISQGQDALPLWIPQTPMAIGSIVLAIALTDHLIQIVFLGDHGIKSEIIDQSHGE